MKSLSITKQALENMQRECDLREEVIEDLEEDKRTQLETIDDLKFKMNTSEIATKHAEAVTCENKILKSQISDLNRDMKVANKESKNF